MTKYTTSINIFATLFAIWLMLNSSLGLSVVLTGIITCAALAYFLHPLANKYSDIRFNANVILHYFIYLGVFLVELVKSNVQVAKLVISPTIKISPAIIKVTTQLKTPIGRLALSNSITLTPGTLVIDIREDTLFVHCIDVKRSNPEESILKTAAKFEI